MVVCKGITDNGTQCKRSVRNGEYCCNHVIQFDEFYQQVDGWPHMAEVNKEINDIVKRSVNDDRLIDGLTCYTTYFCFNNLNTHKRRRCLLICTKVMLMDCFRNFVLSNAACQGLVKKLVEKYNELEKNDTLDIYITNFRRKVDSEYRLAAQHRSYIPLLLSKTILCPDCISIIVSLI